MEDQDDKKSVSSSQTNDNASPKFVLKTCKVGNLVIDLPLVSLCAMNFFLNAACSVIAPFYPNQAKNAGLNSFETGLVIGMHPVGGFLFGLLVAKFMVRMGRRNLMWGSLVVTVITLILMGTSYYMEKSHGLFLAVGLLARFFMGCARSGYGSTTFAYAPLLWPEKVPRVIGIMETFTGKKKRKNLKKKKKLT
jgi:predicted MFS family arabinose efflux permease